MSHRDPDLNPFNPRVANLRAQIDQRLYEISKLQSDIRSRFAGVDVKHKFNLPDDGIYRVSDMRFGSRGELYLRFMGEQEFVAWTETEIVPR